MSERGFRGSAVVVAGISLFGALALAAAPAGCGGSPADADSSAGALADGLARAPWAPVGSTLLPRSLHTMAAGAEGLLLVGGENDRDQIETFLGDGTNWTRFAPAAAPPARYRGQAVAYDAARRQLVMFGGKSADAGYLDDTWIFDGTTWTKATPRSSPGARESHAMEYDAARKQIVMFGGWCGGLYNDTWTWDGTDWTRQEDLPYEVARVGQGMAYDEAHERVVMFGGGNADVYFGDTWSWDGSHWTQLAPAASPPSRQNHAMTYDPLREQIVVFGGYGGSGDERLADTWTWDGTTWTMASPAHAPRPRYASSMAFEGKSGDVVLFAGTSAAGWLNDTWAWDGKDWTERAAPTAPPARTRGQLMVYEAAQDQMVLFGGFGPASGWMNDTWVWNARAGAPGGWTEATPEVSPSLRLGHAMAYDEAHAEIVLFGGFGQPGEMNDTWLWQKDAWTEAPGSRSTASPPGRDGHALAYDAARGVTVLFGGRTSSGLASDTWLWDGRTWTQASPATSPPPRQQHALAYDAARQQILLYGGSSGISGSGSPLKDTWAWDGTTWTEVLGTPQPSRSSPGARLGHAMVYAPSLGRVVLFGGSGDQRPENDDTWTWDGAAWARIVPAVAPPARFGHAVALDSRRGRMMLFGGSGDGPVPELNDTWIWSADR